MSTSTQQHVTVDRARTREVLADLLRSRSVLGESTDCDRLVAGLMESLGFEVSSFRRPTYRGGRTVVARLRGDGDGPVVAFDGHYDTEPADVGRWSVGPWSATETDGRMISRGAVDSKGSLAGMVLALEAIAKSGRSFSGDLMLLSPGDGEAEFGSSFLLADGGYLDDIDYIISGEPTGLDEIGCSYLGSSLWRFSVKGKAAHATQPEFGVNAIGKAAQLVQAVEDGELTFRHEDHPFFTPFGIVHGIRNTAHAEIPDECTFIMIVFAVPGMTLTSIEEDLNAFVAKVKEKHPDVEADVSLIPRETHMWLPPLDEPLDSPVVKAIQDAAKEITDTDAVATKMRIGYVAAAAMVTRLTGRDKRPVAITYGPGDYHEAHTVDESVEVEEVAKFAEVYANAALALVQ
ncbi:MAG TPA: M20/M25/M40 family metallo-hydrolase [Solirubrobacterales bacterium]|jgi:acetylornithine deacetylase/succinyl-diaminopimelate desuccinylase-like protein|nr:M20/M25/M40 family metallo-hydrolase [Solirubrobacterales bacterium]